VKISISDNIIKYYLRDVYFINGHSYAGKSTMVKMLADRYDMIFCGENYQSGMPDSFPKSELSRWKQPALCYFDTMSGWEEWLNLSPEEHRDWVHNCTQDCIEIEIAELIKRAASGKKVIVDTNITLDVLRAISDYHRVAIMLSDPKESAKRFFERDDSDKKFMMEQIKKCKDPEATLANFNSWMEYKHPNDHNWENTGFFTYTRTDYEHDTREEVLSMLAKHFGLE
jgi:dephospho-CoA kinase